MPSAVVGPAPGGGTPAGTRSAAHLRQATAGKPEITLIGDSLSAFWMTVGTASWKAAMAPRGVVDLGVVGKTTRDLLTDIAGGRIKGQPKVVVLMIGTNDLVRGSTPAQVARGIAADVAAIRAAAPQAQVLLMGLFPMAIPGGPSLAAKVAQINAMIARLDDDPRVHFRDIGGAFLLPNGMQNFALFVDGIHLSASGYNVWASQIGGTLDALTGHAPPPSKNVPPPPSPTPAPAPPPRPPEGVSTGPWSSHRR